MTDLRRVVISFSASAIRVLERCLPHSVFCSLAHAGCQAFAIAKGAIHRKQARPVPTNYPGTRPFHPSVRHQAQIYLNGIYVLLSDRLHEPQWRRHVTYIGLEKLNYSKRQPQPRVLVHLHCGPYKLLTPFLRSQGITASALTWTDSIHSNVWTRLPSTYTPIRSSPVSYSRRNGLRPLVRALKKGDTILMAIDQHARHVTVTLENQWTVNVCSGPFRIARRNSAAVIPVSISNTSPWEITLRFFDPLPSGSLENGDSSAAADALQKLMPDLLTHQSQCDQVTSPWQYFSSPAHG